MRSSYSKSGINADDFTKVDFRVGTILEASHLPKARVPAYRLLIDFGPLGKMKSSARITRLYEAEELIGSQVVAVVNFPPRQIGSLMSACLVLGAPLPAETLAVINKNEKQNSAELIAVPLLRIAFRVPNGTVINVF